MTEANTGPIVPPPLPPVVAVSQEVLITSDRAKLPPDVAEWVDPAGRELPPGLQFFERKITTRAVLSALAWSIGLGLLGLLSAAFAIDSLVHPTGPVTVNNTTEWLPLGFALTCGVGSWIMASSWLGRMRLRDTQRAGWRTRDGIFILPDRIIKAADGTWCVIPRSAFRGLDGRTLRYTVKDQAKSLTLPAALVGVDVSSLNAAVTQWAKGDGA